MEYSIIGPDELRGRLQQYVDTQLRLMATDLAALLNRAGATHVAITSETDEDGTDYYLTASVGGVQLEQTVTWDPEARTWIFYPSPAVTG